MSEDIALQSYENLQSCLVGSKFVPNTIQTSAKFGDLYYYMRNFCNLIGFLIEQWYFSLIWNTYTWKLQPFSGSQV